MQLGWVTCSKDASYTASLSQHLVVPGQLTTLCGNTASHSDVWRSANKRTRKPQCTYCIKALEELGKTKTTVTFTASVEQLGSGDKWAHMLDGLTVDELLDLIQAAISKVKRLRLIGNERSKERK